MPSALGLARHRLGYPRVPPSADLKGDCSPPKVAADTEMWLLPPNAAPSFGGSAEPRLSSARRSTCLPAWGSGRLKSKSTSLHRAIGSEPSVAMGGEATRQGQEHVPGTEVWTTGSTAKRGRVRFVGRTWLGTRTTCDVRAKGCSWLAWREAFWSRSFVGKQAPEQHLTSACHRRCRHRKRRGMMAIAPDVARLSSDESVVATESRSLDARVSPLSLCQGCGPRPTHLTVSVPRFHGENPSAAARLSHGTGSPPVHPVPLHARQRSGSPCAPSGWRTRPFPSHFGHRTWLRPFSSSGAFTCVAPWQTGQSPFRISM